jgi:hypothetical protein
MIRPLIVESLVHTTTFPEYPDTKPGGHAYIITLQGMPPAAIANLKKSVRLCKPLLNRLLTVFEPL